MTLVEFLTARLADDVADARYVQAQAVTDGDDVGDPRRADLRLADRVLADVAAKQAIIADHAATEWTYPRLEYDENDTEREVASVPACRQCTHAVDEARVTQSWDQPNRVTAPCDTLRLLAAPYSDHESFDPRWSAGLSGGTT